MSKGDSPRPRSVPYDVYAANYSRIFGKRENHAPATDTTTPHWDAFLCSCGIGYDPECEAHTPPTARKAPAGYFPNAGENI
jgi:hypothetical protein